MQHFLLGRVEILEDALAIEVVPVGLQFWQEFSCEAIETDEFVAGVGVGTTETEKSVGAVGSHADQEYWQMVLGAGPVHR